MLANLLKNNVKWVDKKNCNTERKKSERAQLLPGWTKVENFIRIVNEKWTNKKQQNITISDGVKRQSNQIEKKNQDQNSTYNL